MKLHNKKIILTLLFAAYAVQASDTLLEDEGIKAKLDKATKLVDDAVAQIKKQGIAVSCKAFMSDASWREGEMFPFVFDSQGACYARGYEKDCIWKNFKDEKDEFIKKMAEAGKVGGFVDYKWNNGYSRAYVKNVKVGKKTFIVGAGIFPASSVYVVQELLNSAFVYLKETSFTALKERISNPTGIFVRGDIHLEMYTMDGTCVANGEQIALVGQNLIDAADANGQFVIRDIIKIVKENGEGWYDYLGQSGEPARVYAKKIVDPATNIPHVICCGYYTKITDQTVVSLVKKASNYLKANGREKAFSAFSTQKNEFERGSISIFVYDTKGNMVADSRNPAFVGLNLINTRDAQGRPVTRQILDMANTYGKGWVTNALSNTYQVSYCEKVQVPDGDFIIGAAYFPISKESYVRFMMDDALLFLQNHTLEETLHKFTTRDVDFVRGDLALFVYDMNGICYADGLNLDKIWANDLTGKDDNGVRVMDKVIAIAKTGGGWLKFKLNNAICNIYIKAVDKADKKDAPETYIIGSGYYE